MPTLDSGSLRVLNTSSDKVPPVAAITPEHVAIAIDSDHSAGVVLSRPCAVQLGLLLIDTALTDVDVTDLTTLRQIDEQLVGLRSKLAELAQHAVSAPTTVLQ